MNRTIQQVFHDIDMRQRVVFTHTILNSLSIKIEFDDRIKFDGDMMIGDHSAGNHNK